MGLKVSNNAISRLAGNLSNVATSFSVVASEGALFPTLAAGEWFPATLIKASGAFEIIRVTARSLDTFTVERAQEGTAAQSFLAGDRIEHRLTTAAIAELLLPTGTGPLPWSLLTEPAGWIFCDGRTLAAGTPYEALRNLYIAASFPYGQDGLGNPMIPDMRGRVAAGRDSMGGPAAGRLTGAIMGAALGAETHTLTTTEMPYHGHGVNDPTHAHSVYDPGHTHNMNKGSSASAGAHIGKASTASDTTSSGLYSAVTGIGIYGAATGISIQAAGAGGAHNNVQPTLVTNFIVKT